MKTNHEEAETSEEPKVEEEESSPNNDSDIQEASGEVTSEVKTEDTDEPKTEGDCWDAVTPSKSNDVAEEVKKEKLQPGDHVTRWEMLPIAWPIQVHGIVLNVHEDTVVLVDFGLSVPPADKSKPSVLSSNPKKVEHAIRNFKIGGKKLEKNRLNITVLSDPKDIAKWKKVNYEGGWFTGSSKKDENKEKESNTPTKAQRTKQWFNKMASTVKEKTRPGIDSLKEKATSIRNNVSTSASQDLGGGSKSFENASSTGAATETPMAEDASTASQESSPDLKTSSSLISEGSTSDFSTRPMNPKMKEILQKKQEQRPPKTMNPAMAKILKKKNEESLYDKKKKESLAKLPKSDPSKLVLARTHWLLQHGENILPPYHAFSSNSECIAVFCKTGHWNTVQADVFLHSTAIGNAKTMGATTIAVAASAPLLAPAVAVAGLAVVASPWLYLNKQKNKAVDSQQRLTDSFWAQAEPEVFVACINAWSNDLLGLDDAKNGEELKEADYSKNDQATQCSVEASDIADEKKEMQQGDVGDVGEDAEKPAPVVQQI